MFDHRLALDRRRTSNLASFSLGHLITPVALDKIRAICSQAGDDSLRSEVSNPILSISFNLDYLR